MSVAQNIRLQIYRYVPDQDNKPFMQKLEIEPLTPSRIVMHAAKVHADPTQSTSMAKIALRALPISMK